MGSRFQLSEHMRHQYLDAMGVQVWQSRQGYGVQTEQEESFSLSKEDKKISVDWLTLQSDVASCSACDLCKTRTQTVFGVGNKKADCLVIGEAPGADEDRQGEPFVGKAGQLLNAMLLAISLPRDQVYIANILKCRPPRNRDPASEEVVSCEGYLKQQISLVQPKIILAVGRIAAQNLLKTDTPIGKMRGRHYTYGDSDIPVVVTYHPAYLLRSPREKRKAWVDLQSVQAILY